jgi:hypothetical protein
MRQRQEEKCLGTRLGWGAWKQLAAMFQDGAIEAIRQLVFGSNASDFLQERRVMPQRSIWIKKPTDVVVEDCWQLLLGHDFQELPRDELVSAIALTSPDPLHKDLFREDACKRHVFQRSFFTVQCGTAFIEHRDGVS